MTKLLLAVDGSESSLRATRCLIESAALYREPVQIELVTVHLPVPPVGGFAGAVISHDMVERYYREEGEKALAASKQALEQAGLRYVQHIVVGDIARAIVEQADKSNCEMIYMGTRGMTAASSMLLGSIANKVLHIARKPVVVVH